MKRPNQLALVGLLLALSLPSVATAECLFAYKAKRDNPLQLHYGVISIRGECQRASAVQEANDRLASSGWSLLVLLEQVEESKLNQYKEKAGEYFLRY